MLKDCFTEICSCIKHMHSIGWQLPAHGKTRAYPFASSCQHDKTHAFYSPAGWQPQEPRPPENLKKYSLKIPYKFHIKLITEIAFLLKSKPERVSRRAQESPGDLQNTAFMHKTRAYRFAGSCQHGRCSKVASTCRFRALNTYVLVASRLEEREVCSKIASLKFVHA